MEISRVLMAALLVPILVHTAAAQPDDDLGDLGELDDDMSTPTGDLSAPAEDLSQPEAQTYQPQEQASQPQEQASQPQEQASQPQEQASQKVDEPSTLSVKGYLKLQTGFFVPLISDGFSSPDSQAFIYSGSSRRSLTRTEQPCDPVKMPLRPCYPIDHRVDSGSVSMGRSTLQLELDWTPAETTIVHMTSRGVRAVEVSADEWAQIPEISEDPEERRELAKEWVLQNYYNQFELFRQLYVDVRASDWLSFRIGRQFWSGTGKYQLLDVVNPKDETWHFGPLESYEETRTPLWMVTSKIDINPINHSLELFWVPLIVVPMIDDDGDTVTAPLSLVGAWGIPYSNTPSQFVISNKVFEYPGNRFKDMRAGAQWKGTIGGLMKYSLLYYYTHQLSPPVIDYFDYRRNPDGTSDTGTLDKLIMRFPRQHIAGLSVEFAFESPVDAIIPPFGIPAGLVAKLEAMVEANRTYSVDTNANSLSGGQHQDPNPDLFYRYHFEPEELMVVTYGLSLERLFLNPTVPFLLVGQFKHQLVPSYDEVKHALLVEIPGYNDYRVESDLMQFSFAFVAIFLKGFLVPKLIAAVVLPDSAFYSLDLGVNFSKAVGIHLVATDFFGNDPYQRLGLFRDRDEVNLSLTCRF